MRTALDRLDYATDYAYLQATRVGIGVGYLLTGLYALDAAHQGYQTIEGSFMSAGTAETVSNLGETAGGVLAVGIGVAALHFLGHMRQHFHNRLNSVVVTED